MRKMVVILVLLCLSSLAVSVVNAKPAPNLTSVQITYVGADNTSWIPINQIPTTTLYGQKFYIAVQFIGYPNPQRIFFYQNGSLIPVDQVKEAFAREGIGNPYTGWVYQFAMPISYGNGIITVQADGIRNGTYHNTIYGVKSVYHP
jgi:hypothetical protein